MSVRDKMSQFEVTPPGNAWERIAAALDEAHLSDNFPTTLHDMEVVPPARAWDMIAGSFESPVIRMADTQTRRLLPFLRYAAAAIVIIFAVFFTYRMSTGKGRQAQANSDTTKKSPLLVTTKSTDTSGIRPTVPVTTLDEPPTLAVIAKHASNARAISSVVSHVREATEDDDAHAGTATYAAITDDYEMDIASRYVTLMTPEGGLIRMSKKWSSLLCCLSGSDDDPNCKDQLQQWQKKVACSPISPGAGNFLDILNLVNTLNDDTQL